MNIHIYISLHTSDYCTQCHACSRFQVNKATISDNYKISLTY